MQARVLCIDLLAWGMVLIPIAQAGELSAADRLFREGRAAFEAGDHGAARDKFRESLRLDPTAGTFLNLALSEEKLAQLLDSHEHGQRALDLLLPSDDRRPLAADLVSRLQQRLGRMRMLVVGGLPPSTRVLHENRTILPSEWNTELFVLPGKHTVTIQAAGYRDQVLSVEVSAGARIIVPIVTGPQVSDRPKEPTPKPGDTTSSELRSLYSTWAWTSAIGGAAASGLTLTMGLLALDRKSTVNRECGLDSCSEMGLTASREGKTFSMVATVSGVAALGLLATSVTLFALRPSTTSNVSAGIGFIRLRF